MDQEGMTKEQEKATGVCEGGALRRSLGRKDCQARNPVR